MPYSPCVEEQAKAVEVSIEVVGDRENGGADGNAGSMEMLTEIEVPYISSGTSGSSSDSSNPIENNTNKNEAIANSSKNEANKADMEEIRQVLLQTFAQEDEETCERFRRRRDTLENKVKAKQGTAGGTAASVKSASSGNPASSGPSTADSSFEVMTPDASAETVVMYNDGATPLFQSLEEGAWEAALEIIRHQPEQAKIWVQSTGTVDTTFQWSLFKRLPLHEAVRRHAPLHVLVTLLRAHPPAVRAKTQFGELPLHLAVECGAAPVTVHLLATHHWRGCHETDQSGRTPLDILQEAELLDPDEQLAATECLRAAAATWREIQAEHQAELQRLRAQHAAGLQAVRQQHDDDLAVEQQQQEKLLDQVLTLQQHLCRDKEAAQVLAQRLVRYKDEEVAWQRQTEQLRAENSNYQQTMVAKDETIRNLQATVAAKEEEAVKLSGQIASLQAVLRELQEKHSAVSAPQLEAVNKTFQTAWKELEALNAASANHGSQLKSVVMDLGGGKEEEEDDNDDGREETSCLSVEANPDKVVIQNMDVGSSEAEDDVPEEEAMLRAAQAASSVL